MQEVARDTGSTGRRALARGRAGRQARRAAARFQLACVRLAWAGPKDGSTWPLDALAAVPATTRETEAGRALIDMAEAGDVDGLRRALRPDPGCVATSWTVACYRIGDLVPHSLRDFTDPVRAVTTLAGCGDADHLAAELVASTPEGLCWVALVRTGDCVRFQLLGQHSILGRPGRRGLSQGEEVAAATAMARWAALLAFWYVRQGSRGFAARAGASSLGIEELQPLGGLGSTAGDLAIEVGTASESTVPHPPGAKHTGQGAGELHDGQPERRRDLQQVEQRAEQRDGLLVEVVATLDELAESITGIADAVERLERSLGALTRRLDTAVPLPPPVGAPPPVPRKWAAKHRATRRRPAVGGTATESR